MDRTTYIGCRVSPQELSAIDAAARRDGFSRSEALRDALRRYAEIRGLWPPRFDSTEGSVAEKEEAHGEWAS